MRSILPGPLPGAGHCKQFLVSPGARSQDPEDKKLSEYSIFLFQIEIGVAIEIEKIINRKKSIPIPIWIGPILTSVS